MVVNCKNCFGCVSLRNKIIEHMNRNPFITKRGLVYKYGEFFPEELSPFGYNETSAQELMPLEKELSIEKGYNWYEKMENQYQSTLSSINLPQTINEVSDSILKEIILCQKSGKAYKIFPLELDFLRKNGLPLPDEHPELRHKARLEFINKPFFYNRNCKKCNVKIETSYSPDKSEIVYCDKCYLQEVY